MFPAHRVGLVTDESPVGGVNSGGAHLFFFPGRLTFHPAVLRSGLNGKRRLSSGSLTLRTVVPFVAYHGESLSSESEWDQRPG